MNIDNLTYGELKRIAAMTTEKLVQVETDDARWDRENREARAEFAQVETHLPRSGYGYRYAY